MASHHHQGPHQDLIGAALVDVMNGISGGHGEIPEAGAALHYPPTGIEDAPQLGDELAPLHEPLRHRYK